MNLLISEPTRRQLKAIEKVDSGTYLFFGPDALGKRLSAGELAKVLCAGSMVANMFNLEVEKTSIGIAAITDLIQRLSLKPAKGGSKRVVIVNNAEKLTREAQNAFLKTLEEPPQNTIIILITSSPQQLLPTIISRCQKVRFAAQSTVQIEQYLLNGGLLEPTLAHQAASISAGAIGRAIKLAEDHEQIKAIASQLQLAKEFITSPLYERLILINQVGKTGDLGKMLLNVAQLLRRQLRVPTKGSARVADHIAKTETILEYLKANGNPKLALDTLAMELG